MLEKHSFLQLAFAASYVFSLSLSLFHFRFRFLFPSCSVTCGISSLALEFMSGSKTGLIHYYTKPSGNGPLDFLLW